MDAIDHGSHETKISTWQDNPCCAGQEAKAEHLIRRGAIWSGIDMSAAEGAAPGPEVSVLMPALNAARFIERAIDSVRSQSMRSLELIVVDDGSDDDTFAICRAAAERDRRVVVLRHAERRGVSAARNLALEAARGAWVAVLDADDWFKPERLARLLAHARALDADMIADNQFLVRGDEAAPYRTLLRRTGGAPQRVTLRQFLWADRPRARSASYGLLKPMLRREFLERHGLRYDPSLPFGEDFLFSVAALSEGARFFLVPEPLYVYRRHPSSAVHRLDNYAWSEAAGRRAALLLAEGHPDCLPILARRSRINRRHRRYADVAAKLKSGRILEAADLALRHPATLPMLVARAVRAAVRRSIGIRSYET